MMLIITTMKRLTLVLVPGAVNDDDDAVAVVCGVVKVSVGTGTIYHYSDGRPTVGEVTGCRSRLG